MKTAVLFPGVGYHCDKPLLYYAKKLAACHGYTVREIAYSEMPSRIKGDPEKMAACIRIGLEDASRQLADVDWNGCEDVLMIGKSIGTAVAAAYAARAVPRSRGIWYTPVAETFPLIQGEGIVFHGTDDPWAETPAVIKACEEKRLHCFLTKCANHSLETGDVLLDLAHMKTVMEQTDAYISAFGHQNAPDTEQI